MQLRELLQNLRPSSRTQNAEIDCTARSARAEPMLSSLLPTSWYNFLVENARKDCCSAGSFVGWQLPEKRARRTTSKLYSCTSCFVPYYITTALSDGRISKSSKSDELPPWLVSNIYSRDDPINCNPLLCWSGLRETILLSSNCARVKLRLQASIYCFEDWDFSMRQPSNSGSIMYGILLYYIAILNHVDDDAEPRAKLCVCQDKFPPALYTTAWRFICATRRSEPFPRLWKLECFLLCSQILMRQGWELYASKSVIIIVC